MGFANPFFLLFLLVVPLWVYFYLKKERETRAAVPYPDIRLFRRLPESPSVRFRHFPFALRMAAVMLMILALARPQSGSSEEEILSEGIDIMLVLDISSSMSAEDLKPNRLEVAKQVIRDFIEGRKNDRIGLVLFSGQSFTQCPLTLDYGILIGFLDKVRFGMIEDGTAIGTAITNAANRLRDSTAKTRIAILLTDGVNNRGKIDPETAANAAVALGIKIYAIGVGKSGVFNQIVVDPFWGKRWLPVKTEIDEEMLKKIAKITDGRFYRSQDETSLKHIYEEIDRLEKTELKTRTFVNYTDLFMQFLQPAFLFLLMETLLSGTKFRRAP